MTLTPVQIPDLEPLRARGEHLVTTAADAGWDEARQAFNLAVDQHPALVAHPDSVEDIVAVVEFARQHGLRIAPQRTGHNAAPIESLADTVLLRTDRLTGVDVYPEARSARVEAGAKWGQVSDAADPYGLSGLAGSARDVGVVGYHLGGGLSFIGRKHGLATNAVTAIELVTAGGRIVRVTADNEPDLFWALRGGGGSFGVVTALEFELFETPEIYAGTLFFPHERSAEVLHAWREWTLGMPDELTSVGRMLALPDVAEIPDPLRGRSFATVGVVFLGDEAEGAALVEPIRALGAEIDTLASVPPAALGYFAMDPEDPLPYASEHLLAETLPPEAVDALVAVAGPGSDSALAVVELRHTGAALGRGGPEHGALDTLPGEFLMFAVAPLMAPEMAAPAREQLDRVRAALAPYAAGRYLNFTEGPVAPDAFHAPAVLERLAKLKAAWDPDGLFLANHEIPAAAVG
jgi:FAD/FMN-containing dehydrogenase